MNVGGFEEVDSRWGKERRVLGKRLLAGLPFGRSNRFHFPLPFTSLHPYDSDGKAHCRRDLNGFKWRMEQYRMFDPQILQSKSTERHSITKQGNMRIVFQNLETVVSRQRALTSTSSVIYVLPSPLITEGPFQTSITCVRRASKAVHYKPCSPAALKPVVGGVA